MKKIVKSENQEDKFMEVEMRIPGSIKETIVRLAIDVPPEIYNANLNTDQVSNLFVPPAFVHLKHIIRIVRKKLQSGDMNCGQKEKA